MKQKDLVWRELIDAAIFRDQRRWQNVEDLAFSAGVAPSTAVYALGRLIEIGAVRQHYAGFTVVNPAKVLTSFCATRSIVKDAVARFAMWRSDVGALGDVLPAARVIVGGPDAAVALLGGSNTVSDYHDHLVYLREDVATYNLDHLVDLDHTLEAEGGATVTVLVADRRAARTWDHHTSFAQTYADLFATPGWQASEFRLALEDAFLSRRDWDQES